MNYDPRYLLGIEAFNRGDYFDAHEIWEELWNDCDDFDRLYYQSLIQAAVALYHKGRNNLIGATRLLAKGQAKANPYRPHHLGLDIDPFWQAVAAAIRSDQTMPMIQLNV